MPEESSEELSEEIGLHIGDGSMNFYKYNNKFRGLYSLRGHLKDDRTHYEFRIKQLYEDLFNLKLSLREMKSSGVFGFQKWSNALVTFKKRLGLSLGVKYKIDIPRFILKSRKSCLCVTRGIFDTDGTIYLEKKNNSLYPRVIIGTISKQLAFRLKKLISGFDINATLYTERRAHKGWNDFFVISVRGDKMLHKWMETINPANPKHMKKYQFYLDNH